MSTMLADRRGVTSLEYALLAGAIGLMLMAVLRVVAISTTQYLAHVLISLHAS